MTHQRLVAAAAAALGLGIVALAGCGGSNSGGGGGNSPSISSFAASPAAINNGSSSNLTGVFTNGTGVITPGNLAATSGAAVSVSPTSTTTYTLTVTGSGGTTVTATTTVTINPLAITSFTASPATITSGGSSSLTAMFTGGNGVLTPGNISVTSGTAVSVSPTATTTYTLTVTPSSGAAITQTVTVNVVLAPTITSFIANPTTTDPVQGADLTGVFAEGGPPYGTAIITPGNYQDDTGLPKAVHPTTTTTYTLTVTNAAGTAVTATATVTVVPAPAITSFTASPATITTGGSSSLSPVFTGGTGVITGGAAPINATSGTPVSVSPTTTTTYTLTVTDVVGTNVVQTATVTVVPPPAITSFTANPTSIASGDSSDLTGVFADGTGVVTPGNLSITSNTPLSVSPTATTTYTLTVTNAASKAVTQTAKVTVTVPADATVTVNPASPGIAVTDQILGMNMAAWYDEITNANSITTAFNGAGIKAIRWPGGSWSDGYHWGYQTGSSSLVAPYNCTCSTTTSCTANDTTAWAGYATFAQFANAIPLAGPYDLALTANYGTNEECTSGGDPKEAAAWAAAAVADGITPSHMTVGNEEYGGWETDLHSTPNDPTIYASTVVGSSGYYKLIKAASPKTLVGVDVDASTVSPTWDSTVLGNAAGSYDFVEFHFYPQNPGNENDSFLVTQAPQTFTQNITTLKSQLQTAGKPNTPIYVGEMGSVSSNPGVQSWSITQGLFAGQVLGEMMNDGISRATWWIGFGNCGGDSGNFSSSLYGWQNFGAYNVFSDGTGDTGGNTNAPCDYGSPIGSPSPTAQAFSLFQNVAVTGEHVLTPALTGDAGPSKDVRAYAATHSGGTALVLFNVNETTSETVQVTIDGEANSPGVTVITYNKGIYDYTNTSCQLDPTCTYDPAHNYSTAEWANPTTTSMGTQSLPLTITLTPWSMNVVLIK